MHKFGWISRRLLITLVMIVSVVVVAAACSQQPASTPSPSMPTPIVPSEATGFGPTPPALSPTALQPATTTATPSGALSASPTPTRAAQMQSLTRTDDGQGSITVEVTWVTQAHLQQMRQTKMDAYPINNNVLLHVKLDTHSVDLSKYDLAQLATLRGSDGPAGTPIWVGITDSGHHREGVLVFSGQGSEQWISKEGKSKLVLSGIGGVAERTFTWEF